MIRPLLTAILSLAIIGCTSEAKADYSSEIHPVVEATLVEVVGTTATVTVKYASAEKCAMLCLESTEAAPGAADIFAKGQEVLAGNITISCKKEATSYTAYFAAVDAGGSYSDIVTVSFDTPDSLYPWERQRKVGGYTKGPGKSDRFEPYDNMLLLYGGNVWRTPAKWNKDRMSAQITYKDTDGVEHWLFDAFLLLDIWDRLADGSHSASLGTGYGGDSADKRHWMHFIDYWFEDGYGLSALDKAVKSAASRIGEPATKRKVVFSIPDPIIYKSWDDASSSTTYWGELDGRTLDFSIAQDRLAACKWYVDEVRARWDSAGFQNIELYGFYCFSEELATPTQGYQYELKKWDQVYPALSEYVHSCNEPMSWIPYNWAAGFDRWTKFQFDFAMMQPNYTWHPEYSMSDWKSRTKSANLSMELEMDYRCLEGRSEWQDYRSRFLSYYDLCKDLDLYGKTVLSYYLDSNMLYELLNSKSDKDRELYDSLCQFVLGNIQQH